MAIRHVDRRARPRGRVGKRNGPRPLHHRANLQAARAQGYKLRTDRLCARSAATGRCCFRQTPADARPDHPVKLDFRRQRTSVGGTRFVSPATVTLMTSDHLTPETRRSPSTPVLFGALAPSPELGLGFGLGFAVGTHAG